MKKSLIALAIAATTAAGSVSAAEIYKTDEGSINFYGQLRTELKWNDIGENNPELSSGSSRMGIDGAYKLTDDVKVIGLVEVSVDEDSDMYVRQHIFGLASDSLGTIKFGKQWTVSDDVYGADYSYFYGGSALRYGTLSGAEHDAMIKYEYVADSFWIKADYGLPNNDKEQELAELFAGTSFGDLDVHVGGGYNIDQAIDVKNTYGEATAEYNYSKGVIGFTYYYAKLESQSAVDSSIEENGFSLAGTFAWSDKGTGYAGYEYTKQDPDSGNLDSEDGTLIYLGSDYQMLEFVRVYAEVAYADGTTLGYEAGGSGSGNFVGPTMVDSEVLLGLGARFYW
ncbi:porin [Vibrio algicola]|uniref:Porin n=1 Tax=Vibrio algicola TaxID=2662262 RepID=A0A5Q0TDJ5_9VIBR|nr:porin [Vibrio algicola]